MTQSALHVMKILLPSILALLFLPGKPLNAQEVPAKGPMKCLMVNGGGSGLTAAESDNLLAQLRGKLSHFTSLSTQLRGEFAKSLTKDEKAAVDKCSDINCLLRPASKAGFQRILLCRFSKKNAAYTIQSVEYELAKGQKISSTVHTGVCEDAEALDDFLRDAAVKIGQSLTHSNAIPAQLEASKSNLWWYIGTAATLGITAGVYLLVSKPKQPSATPQSLPLPPGLP